MTQEEQPPRQVGIQSNSGGEININQSQVQIAGGNIYNPPLERDSKQNKFLDKVENIWIKGMLERVLHEGKFIELGLHTRPDAVENVWESTIQDSKELATVLPVSTRIIQAYDDAAGELLILGEPGAGKTIMLLDLVQNLLERARRNEQSPMPVVFHLSSWAEKQQPLVDWLITELQKKYHVSKKSAGSWIESDEITPLLDGLDEVEPRCRAACIKAINAYLDKHGSASLVVCSRKDEYLDQPERLILRSAIVIQPLTKQQIDDYLLEAGEEFTLLRIYLYDTTKAPQEAHNLMESLQKLVTTPLMLSILVQAYKGKTTEEIINELPEEKTIKKQQEQMFATYVQRMLSRRMKPRYTREQVIHWLTWLAQQMKQRHLTEFSFDQIYKDWVPMTHGYQLLCYITTIGLAFVVGSAIGAGYFLIFWAVLSRSGFDTRSGFDIHFVMLWFGCIFGVFSTPNPRNVNGTIVVERSTTSILLLLSAIQVGAFTLVLEILSIAYTFFSLLIAHQADKILYTLLQIVPSILLGGFMFWLFLPLLVAVGGTRPIKRKRPGPYRGGYVEYIVSRLLLSIAGCIPVCYSRFLDHMTSYMLLHKIGRNYFFIHPLLLDYFANNYSENHPKN